MFMKVQWQEINCKVWLNAVLSQLCQKIKNKKDEGNTQKCYIGLFLGNETINI